MRDGVLKQSGSGCVCSMSVLALMLAAAACGASPLRPTSAKPAPDSSESPAPVVVAFGDSLTHGPGLDPVDTYPAVLQEMLEQRGYPHRVVNSGVSGDTTADGLRRFERALVPGTQIVILALGANDGLGRVPIATIRANLARMIDLAAARGIRVLLCGMETPPVHGLQYSVDFHFLFPDLAAEKGVPLVPFMLAGVVGRADMNLEDGVHPNAAGAKAIAATIRPYLEPMLAIVSTQ